MKKVLLISAICLLVLTGANCEKKKDPLPQNTNINLPDNTNQEITDENANENTNANENINSTSDETEEITLAAGLQEHLMSNTGIDYMTHAGDKIYFDADGGLGEYDLTYGTFQVHPLGLNIIGRAPVQGKDNLWIATANGFIEYDPSTHTMIQEINSGNSELISDSNIDLAWDPELGVLWVGSYQHVQSFNPETKEWKTYDAELLAVTDENGLDMGPEMPSRYQIVNSKDAVWFIFSAHAACRGGIIRYLKSNGQFTYYWQGIADLIEEDTRLDFYDGSFGNDKLWIIPAAGDKLRTGVVVFDAINSKFDYLEIIPEKDGAFMRGVYAEEYFAAFASDSGGNEEIYIYDGENSELVEIPTGLETSMPMGIAEGKVYFRSNIVGEISTLDITTKSWSKLDIGPATKLGALLKSNPTGTELITVNNDQLSRYNIKNQTLTKLNISLSDDYFEFVRASWEAQGLAVVDNPPMGGPARLLFINDQTWEQTQIDLPEEISYIVDVQIIGDQILAVTNTHFFLTSFDGATQEVKELPDPFSSDISGLGIVSLNNKYYIVSREYSGDKKVVIAEYNEADKQFTTKKEIALIDLDPQAYRGLYLQDNKMIVLYENVQVGYDVVTEETSFDKSFVGEKTQELFLHLADQDYQEMGKEAITAFIQELANAMQTDNLYFEVPVNNQVSELVAVEIGNGILAIINNSLYSYANSN